MPLARRSHFSWGRSGHAHKIALAFLTCLPACPKNVAPACQEMPDIFNALLPQGAGVRQSLRLGQGKCWWERWYPGAVPQVARTRTYHDALERMWNEHKKKNPSS